MPNWNAGDELTSAKLNKSLAGLAATAQAMPDMTLKVTEGVVRFGKSEVRFAGGDSPAFTAPVSNNRIDLLVINSSGVLEIIQGTAAVSPAVPAYPATKFVIAEVYLRAGATSIKIPMIPLTDICIKMRGLIPCLWTSLAAMAATGL